MDEFIKRPKFETDLKSAWDAKASDYPDQIVKQYNVGETEQKGTIHNIVNLFHQRYKAIRKIIRMQCGFRQTADIREILKEKGRKSYNIIVETE